MHTNTRTTRRVRARRLAAASAVATVAITGLASAPARAEEDSAPVLRAMICDQHGICLAYTAALRDSDGDGVADIDEEAAHTSSVDPAGAPGVDVLTALVGAGALPSFEAGVSVVIVLPETFPDGTPLVSDIASATKARSSALADMGIGDELLKAYGLDLGSGVVLDQAAGAIGMHLDKDGRPVKGESMPPVQKRVGGIVLGWIGADDGGTGGEKGDGAPVDMSGSGAFGSDRNGGGDFWTKVKEGVKEMFSGEKKPDKPDGGVPTSLTTGDEGNAVLPITDADMEKVVTRLGATTKPVSVDPKIGPEITGVDLNPHRTIILTDDPEQKKLPGDILKLVLTAPDPQDPDVQNTNFGPNGGIVPAVESGSGWPKR